MDNVSIKLSSIKAMSILKMIVGIIFIIINVLIAILYLFACMMSGFSFADIFGIMIGSIILAACFIAVKNGNNTLKLIKIYPTYAEKLADNKPGSIVSLASSLNVTVDNAMKNVCTMLALGLFPDCYIDLKNKRLVSPEKKVEKTKIPKIQVVDREVEYVTVQCEVCGAKNKIVKGTSSECEYCGSEIHSKIDIFKYIK